MILDVFWIFFFAKIARVWPKSGKCQATLVQCSPQTDSGSANVDDRTGTNVSFLPVITQQLFEKVKSKQPDPN